MSSINVSARPKESSVSAVVTRADGRVEDLGVVSYWHVNPLKRWWFKLRNPRVRVSTAAHIHPKS